MKKAMLLLTLFLIPLALAQPGGVVVHMPPSLPDLPSGVQILMDIEIKGSIDTEITELSYVHRLSGRTNETMKYYLEYNLDSEPEILEVEVNGKSVEPSVMSKTPYYSNYRVPLSIGEKVVTVESRLKYQTRPQGGRGLWRDQFSFSNPVSLTPLTGPIFARTMKGEIKLPEEARQVQCGNCLYDAEESLVRVNKINEPPYISFSFQVKKKAPVKAGAVYVLMLLGIFGFVLRERSRQG